MAHKKKSPAWVHEKDRSDLLSERFNVPEIDLAAYRIDRDVITLVTREVAARWHALPVHRAGGTLIVAFSNPDAAAVEAFQRVTGMKVEPIVAADSQIDAAIADYYAPAK